MNAIISGLEINNELDVILAHKRAEQLSEFLGIRLSEKTKLATAISEICRNCLEYATEGKITQEISERSGKPYLQCTIEDKGPGIAEDVLEKLKSGTYNTSSIRGHGLTNAKKLADYCEITSGLQGTEIKVGIRIPNNRIVVTAEKIIEWRNFFKNEPPVSPYDELKKRNAQLLVLTEELELKNGEIQSALDKAKINEESFLFIASNVPDMIWKANSAGEIEYINSHWKTYTGKTIEKLKKWGWLSSIHPEERQQLITLWHYFINNKISFSMEFRLQDMKGEFFWHSLRAQVIPHNDGGELSWVGTITNIDTQKRSSMELENIVSTRTEQLELSNAELFRSNADLEQFAYVASHDLAEPIRMVSNFTMLLAKKYHDKLDSEANEFIDFISEGASRMQLLISDLLNYSRVGRKDTVTQVVDANEVLKNVKKYLGEKIEISGAIIKSTVLPKVSVLDSTLYQLFQNLIDNALKFKGEPTPVIEISAEFIDNFWRFSIKDNGIGMDPQFVSKIFTIFQRLNTRIQYPGTGIGLAICKKIVELHGGRIWVETALGSGTTFFFTLPPAVE